MLLRGVVPFCDEHGFLNARMRCAMNLSAWEMVGQPAARHGRGAGGAGDRASTPARRLGRRAGRQLGRGRLRGGGVGRDPGPRRRPRRGGAAARRRERQHLRAASTSSAPTAGRSTRRRRPSSASSGRRWTTSRSPAPTTTHPAHLRFAAGDHEAMRRHAAELLGNREMYPYDVIPAARASLWLRDAAGMREALGERDVSVGRATDLRFAVIRAGLAALEGRTDDARAGYLAAEAGLRELGIRFELGLAAARARRLPRRRSVGRRGRRRGARHLRGAGRDRRCSRGCPPRFPPLTGRRTDPPAARPPALGVRRAAPVRPGADDATGRRRRRPGAAARGR